MGNKKGFTLIEVAIAVAIIGVLASLTVITFIGQQVKARDYARSSKATLIADSLERYYEVNGEYPSARAIHNTYAGNTGSAVAGVLSIKEPELLVMPTAAAGTTNSIAPSLGSADVIAYAPSSTTGNTNCQSSLAGGCDKFTLSYKEESTGNTVTIESRNKGYAAVITTPLQAPAKPTVTAVQTSATVLTATSSAPTCSAGMTPQYSFRVQVNALGWGAWTSMGAGNTTTQTGGPNGTNYSFQSRVRCNSASMVSDVSPDSDVDTVMFYVMPSAPAAPTVAVSMSGGIVTGTTSSTTCSLGTPQYLIDYSINDGTWSIGAWGSATTRATTAYDGYKYEFRSSARCVNGTQTSPASATSAEAAYIHPIAAPAAPTVSGATYPANTWTWTPSSCPSGTSPQYSYYFSYYNGVTWVASTGSVVTTGTTATNPAATSQGLAYSVGVSQQCYNSYALSGFSGGASGGVMWVPVAHVQLLKWAMRMDTGEYTRLRFNTFSGPCASGTQFEMYLTADWEDTGFALVADWFTLSDTVASEKLMNMIKLTSLKNKIEFWPRTRCRNTSTNYDTNASGSTMVSRLYNIGNLYRKSATTYSISCGWGSAGNSWCSGGFDSGGGNATGTSYDACALRAGGIEDANNRFTPITNYNTGTACWSA